MSQKIFYENRNAKLYFKFFYSKHFVGTHNIKLYNFTIKKMQFQDKKNTNDKLKTPQRILSKKEDIKICGFDLLPVQSSARNMYSHLEGVHPFSSF
jgi:hypothetical protein